MKRSYDTISLSSAPIVLRDQISRELSLLRPVVRAAKDLEGIRADLQLLGFCCVGDILTELEIEQFESSFWSAISCRFPALKREDSFTWTPENCNWRVIIF